MPSDGHTDEADRLVQKIRNVLNIPEDEDLVVRTPQFERQDGVEPGDPPLTQDGMDAIKNASEEELKNLGLQKWSDDTGLWLLPHEWHPHIPEDLPTAEYPRRGDDASRLAGHARQAARNAVGRDRAGVRGR